MILLARCSRLVSLCLSFSNGSVLIVRINDYHLSVERNYYPWQQINYCRHPLCFFRKFPAFIYIYICIYIYISLIHIIHIHIYVYMYLDTYVSMIFFFSFLCVSFLIKSVHFTISIDKYLVIVLKHLWTLMSSIRVRGKNRFNGVDHPCERFQHTPLFRSHCIPRSACVTVSAAEFCCFLDHDVSNRVLCCSSICNLTSRTCARVKHNWWH